MAFFTKSEAKVAAGTRRQRLAKSASQILGESSRSEMGQMVFDVFLSHSINDANLVLGVMVLLERQGLSVYVDWITDSELDRTNVTKETAARLRDRMQHSKSLLYIASENASTSKWMPWELGYFDGLRMGGVAILPLLDDADDPFPEQEYLNLYPIVDKDIDPSSNSEAVFVEEYGKRWTRLKEFATGHPSWKRYA
jgi:hypothetical protein